MSLEPDKRQLKIEADHFLKILESLPVDPEAELPENYLVESLPMQAYRPQAHLERMMTAAQYAELSSILYDLHSLNENHVGEPYLEVAVYFSLTGVHQSLQDRMFAWTRSFLLLRLQKYNPKDRDDAYRKFMRLFMEYLSLFHAVDYCVDYLITGHCVQYAAWIIYEHTLKNDVRIRESDDGVDFASRTPLDDVQKQVVQFIFERFHFFRDDLSAFFKRALADGIPPASQERLNVPDGELWRRIMLMGEDINTMRQLLVRDSCMNPTVLRLSPSLTLAVEWAAHSGIMNLYFGYDEAELLERMVMRRVCRTLHIARDGSLLDGKRPWIRMGDITPSPEVSGIALNAYILDSIHEKLFGIYEEIDKTRLRDLASTKTIPEDMEDEVLAWSCQELAVSEPFVAEPEAMAVDVELETGKNTSIASEKLETSLLETVTGEKKLNWAPGSIPHLRLRRFLHVLEHRLGCEVRGGKGDETTIFRPGGKKFCIGRPSQVHSVIVKRALRRLNISTPEWLRAVGC